MYCTQCGVPLSPQNVVCPSCGVTQPWAASPSPMSPQRGRLSGHLHLLAIFWFVVGVLWLMPSGILLAVGSISIFVIPFGEPGAEFARVLGPLVTYMVAGFLLMIAVLCFAAGWGLLHRRRWARALSIVLGVISLLSFPFGTALGIYTLWVLAPAGAGDEYERMAAGA